MEINGVKMKFHNEQINLFKKFDIIVIHESHFAERTRCPNGFLLVCQEEQFLTIYNVV